MEENFVYDMTPEPHFFDKVLMVRQGNDSLVYTYGHDRQRISMEEHVGKAIRTKRYVGSCEYVAETNGGVTSSRWLTYLTSPTGVYAVVVTENGTDSVHYILKDHLGSWTAVTDSEGDVEQRLSYDAWGNLRDPDIWSGSFTGRPMFDRGFTGHEHLTAFGLINMKFTVSERSAKLCLGTAERCELGEANGRMYDPMMSSFLSVDRYVQYPGRAQGFNRYAYCLHNPLRYVDPTGWTINYGGTGHHGPDEPLEQVVVDGQASFVLPEVIITPDNTAPIYWNEFQYTPSSSGGGRPLGWNSLNTNNKSMSSIGSGSGGGNINNSGQPLFGQACQWTTEGNLEWRTDTTLNLKETFEYDRFNRLLATSTMDLAGTVTHATQGVQFDNKGNITQKDGVGGFAYGGSNPYAVTALGQDNALAGLLTNQTVTYTPFDKVGSVTQEGKTLTVDYGIDRQRISMEEHVGVKEKFFSANYHLFVS